MLTEKAENNSRKPALASKLDLGCPSAVMKKPPNALERSGTRDCSSRKSSASLVPVSIFPFWRVSVWRQMDYIWRCNKNGSWKQPGSILTTSSHVPVVIQDKHEKREALLAALCHGHWLWELCTKCLICFKEQQRTLGSASSKIHRKKHQKKELCFVITQLRAWWSLNHGCTLKLSALRYRQVTNWEYYIF